MIFIHQKAKLSSFVYDWINSTSGSSQDSLTRTKSGPEHKKAASLPKDFCSALWNNWLVLENVKSLSDSHNIYIYMYAKQDNKLLFCRQQ